MIVLVVVVLAFVAFRAPTRDNDEVDVEPVDYLAVVAPAQEAGPRIVYPPSLPVGGRPHERGRAGQDPRSASGC